MNIGRHTLSISDALWKNRKDIWRPIIATIVFQPLALLWCLMLELDYLSTIGPFTIYATVGFMPIYWAFEKYAHLLGFNT